MKPLFVQNLQTRKEYYYIIGNKDTRAVAKGKKKTAATDKMVTNSKCPLKLGFTIYVLFLYCFPLT
jgi:hypothetical protein